MSVQFNSEKNLFVINTRNTTYAFDIIHGRYLRHLYYGKSKSEPFSAKEYKAPCTPYRQEENGVYMPFLQMHEYSFFGVGDFRCPSLRIRGADGTGVTEPIYESHRIFEGRRELDGLPSARADGNTQTLEITLYDDVIKCRIILYYTVFYDEDVISRYMVVQNCGKENVRVEKCASLTLDIDSCELDLVTLYGAPNSECTYQRVPLIHGIHTMTSPRGTSSHQQNPFFALCARGINEERGEAYGFNFVYSGSFLNEIEKDQFSRTRVTVSVGGDGFSYLLTEGECFTSPEAIVTYSDKGLGGMTRNMHAFVRAHILSPSALKPHPVVLNTWEACYFNIDEKKLFDFADEAKTLGFDMLVMDDGWFGARNHDRAGLGDWFENPEKFPNGLKTFVDGIRSRGLGFGIWIEPEMVNPDSDLYRTHPDWCLRVAEREPMLSRSQLVLDMTHDDVIEYLTEIFDRTFAGVEIDYFKWDMNRYLCGIGSKNLPAERQAEIGYRYVKGVYRLLDRFAKHFPNAIIETCSGGGGRYDLGMMCYGFQIWASDNTDPYARTRIQYGALTAYPSTTMSCHVSDPKNSIESLDYRYKVAVGGMLGYELNILKMDDDIKSRISCQVAEYRKYEHLIRGGDYYSLVSPLKDNYSAYFYSAQNGEEILLTVIEGAECKSRQTKLLKICTALPEVVYEEQYSGTRYTSKELKKGIKLPLSGEKNTAHLLYLKRI